MPERIDHDDVPVIYRREIPTEFEQAFEVEPLGDDPKDCPPDVATISCRHCPAKWDTVLEQMATIHHQGAERSVVGRTIIHTIKKGVRNSLMAHAAVHEKGYMPTIRRRR